MPLRPSKCIGKNVTLKPTKNSQKFHLPEPLAQHPSGDLREPVVEGAEQREDRAADQHVVEMRDDEVGVVHLQVERHRREHHAGQPADHEDEDEAEHEEHRRREARRARARCVAIQQKICTPLGIAIIMLAAVKKLSPSCGMRRGEHVVHPQAERHEAVAISDSTIAG